MIQSSCVTMGVTATIILLLWTIISGSASAHQNDDPFDYRYLLNDVDSDAGKCIVDEVLSTAVKHQPCPTVPQCICTYCDNGVQVNCSHTNLTAIPKHLPNNTIQLELQGNKITVIEPDIFKHYPKIELLNLSTNAINVLHKDSFNGLKSLKSLSVANNTLYMVENESISTGLPSLQHLDLSYNTALQFRSLPNITYGLQNTNITSMELTQLHSIFGDCTHLCDNELRYINRTKIESLTLDTNRLAFICYWSVIYFPRTLKYLSVRDNRLTLGLYVHFILTNKMLSNLVIFIMSQQDKTHILDSFRIESTENERAMKETSLIEGKPPTRLPKISQTNQSSIIHAGKGTKPLFSKRGVRNHINSNIIRSVPPFNRNLRVFPQCCGSCHPCYKTISIPTPRNLTYLDASERKAHMRISRLCLCTPNKLTIVKLNKNMYYSWKRTLRGGSHITSLDLSENGCSEVSKQFFYDMKNLKFLNVSVNFLGFSLKLDTNGDTFSTLQNLETLDLSNNKLEKLPSLIFQGLTNLTTLLLANNQLSSVSLDIQHLTKLKSMELQENMLQDIDATTRNQFDRLALSHDFTVDLSKNKFQCTCATLDFVLWMSKTSVNFTDFRTYKCRFINGTTGQLTSAAEIYNELQKDCANYTVLIISVCSVFILFLSLAIGAILYRYRWNLRYMYYSARFRMRGYTAVTQDEDGFNFEAFVSYSDTEGGFVRQHILPELEEKRGVRLLIHERDFRAGQFVADNIMQAITTSKKMLIILTQDYMNSTWCKYEMNMARMETIKTGRDVICVLMKEEMPAANLPLEIMDVIQQQTYLELPTEPDHLQQFWDRLKSALVDN